MSCGDAVGPGDSGLEWQILYGEGRCGFGDGRWFGMTRGNGLQRVATDGTGGRIAIRPYKSEPSPIA